MDEESQSNVLEPQHSVLEVKYGDCGASHLSKEIVTVT